MPLRPTTYLFAGGGTGGHLFPGLAVAAELQARDPQARIVFVGSNRGIERDIVQRQHYRHVPLPVESSATLRRHPVRFLWRNWQARNQAISLLDELQPTAVIGLGGFASVPVVWAAHSRRVPAILLEQNIVPGRATRWLSGWANSICLSFDTLHGKLSPGTHTCLTGNPVSREIAQLRTQRQAHRDSQPPTLLILGGSQGATAVNNLALGAIETLQHPDPAATCDAERKARSDRIHAVSSVAQQPGPHSSGHYKPTSSDSLLESQRTSVTAPLRDWRIMHQTGETQHAEVAARYAALGIQADTAPFFTDMPARYARATIAITRGGATSLAELAVVGVPSIIVPYPNSIGDHQRLNAQYYEAAGAAQIVEQQPESQAAIDRMADALSRIICDPTTLRAMSTAMHSQGKPDAATAVVEQIERVTSIQHSQRRSA